MDRIDFEWDENKNRINKKKHRVSFEEAVSVFYDFEALVIPDPDHSTLEEERFLIVGNSEKMNCLTVVHCVKEDEEVIRIISARRATRKEETDYLESKGEIYA